MIFPQYCIYSPNRHTDIRAISHNIKVLLPFSGCGQLWDIAYNLHYHTCQSELFRRHVCSAYKAANVIDAFDRLKAMINNFNEQAEKKGE